MKNYLISLFVLFPLIIGLIRFRKIDRSYQLFVYLMLMYLVNETITFASKKLFHSNTVNFNIFSLIEGLYLNYLFHLWGFLKKQKKLFLLLQVGITVLWIIEYLVFWKLTDFSPYYRLVYSFILVLLSINQINYLLIHNSKNLLKNGQFLICLAFLIFFMYQILYEISYHMKFASPDMKLFERRVVNLFVYLNVFMNFLYGIAMLFIPKKEKPGFQLNKID